MTNEINSWLKCSSLYKELDRNKLKNTSCNDIVIPLLETLKLILTVGIGKEYDKIPLHMEEMINKLITLQNKNKSDKDMKCNNQMQLNTIPSVLQVNICNYLLISEILPLKNTCISLALISFPQLSKIDIKIVREIDFLFNHKIEEHPKNLQLITHNLRIDSNKKMNQLKKIYDCQHIGIYDTTNKFAFKNRKVFDYDNHSFISPENLNEMTIKSVVNMEIKCKRPWAFITFSCKNWAKLNDKKGVQPLIPLKYFDIERQQLFIIDFLHYDFPDYKADKKLLIVHIKKKIVQKNFIKLNGLYDYINKINMNFKSNNCDMFNFYLQTSKKKNNLRKLFGIDDDGILNGITNTNCLIFEINSSHTLFSMKDINGKLICDDIKQWKNSFKEQGHFFF